MSMFVGFGALSAAFSERNFRIFTIGNILSHNGSWAQRTAVLWLTWELTHSGLWLGLISLADLLPVVFIGPVAGALADRVNLLTMMKVTQVLAACQSALLAGLALTGLITPEILLLLVLAHGIILSFNQPARLAIVPHISGERNLPAAVGINAMVFNSARATGPMIGGILIAGHGAGYAFLFNAVSYLWFVGSLFLMRLADPRSNKDPSKLRKLPKEVWEGICYAVGHPGIGRLLVILLVVALCARPYMELLAGFADEVLGQGARGYSLMVSVTGIGAMAGAFWLAQRGRTGGLSNGLVVSVLVLSLSLLGFSLTGLFWFALSCLLMIGFSVIVIGAGEQVLIQNAVDPKMRGRVLSLYGMIGRGGPAIGALIMGSAAELLGFRIPLLVGALICLILWVWTWRQRDIIRDEME